MALKQPGFPNTGRTIREYSLAASETFKVGAVLIMDSSENLAEAGTDPVANIMGLAVGDAAGIAGTTYGGGGTREFDTDYALVAVAGSGRTFLMPGDNDPVKADIGEDYGLAVDSDGVWYVDGTDTTNVAVNVVNIDTDRNLYEVSFLATVLDPATGA